MADLKHRIELVVDLDEAMIRDMFFLYEHYYAGTSESLFRSDLANKKYVILLGDESDRLRGFSTAVVTEHQFQGERLRSLFSGDTIVDERYWGQQALGNTWLQLAGYVKSGQPEIPLYWFLLVKGHRTYRYLHAFFKVFYPSYEHEMTSRIKSIMDMLASERYGDNYDIDRGVIDFPTSHGHLKPSWADIPEKDRSRPDVKFFLDRNPGYVKGDELVCLAELVMDNMRPLPGRIFRKGMVNGI